LIEEATSKENTAIAESVAADENEKKVEKKKEKAQKKEEKANKAVCEQKSKIGETEKKKS